MDNIEVLFYFLASDKSIFIELKRLNFKKCSDKSKYVSWFRIKDNLPYKLNFVKMSEKQRDFIEGKLILNNGENIFIEENNQIILKEDIVDVNNINLCLSIWD